MSERGSQPLPYEKAEKLARDIVVDIVETSLMFPPGARLLDISPEQKLEIGKCALKALGKVRGSEIEDRIRYLLSQVKIVKK